MSEAFSGVIMVFGYWAVFTGVVCVVGFTYMMIESFGEDEVK